MLLLLLVLVLVLVLVLLLELALTLRPSCSCSFGMPPLAVFELMRRFLLAQSIIKPFVFTALLTLPLHWLGLWLLVDPEAGLGFDGLAIAHVITNLAQVGISLAWIVYLQPHDPESWNGVELRGALQPARLWEYVKLAVPEVNPCC